VEKEKKNAKYDFDSAVEILKLIRNEAIYKYLIDTDYNIFDNLSDDQRSLYEELRAVVDSYLKPKITIETRGGVIQCITSTHRDINIKIIDYDEDPAEIYNGPANVIGEFKDENKI